MSIFDPRAAIFHALSFDRAALSAMFKILAINIDNPKHFVSTKTANKFGDGLRDIQDWSNPQ